MKKILTIALVALLAASSVFAGFSGSTQVGFGYNTEERDFGFSNTTETKLEYVITSGEYPVAVEENAEAEAPAEETKTPSVFAGIKGSFTLKATDATLGLDSEVSEAYVGGNSWKVSILSAADGLDYAKSSIDSYYDADAKKVLTTSVKVAAAKAAGVTATYNGWTLGAGIVGGLNEVPSYNTDGKVLVNVYKYYKNAEDAKADKVSTYYGTSKDWSDFKEENKPASKNDWILISEKAYCYATPVGTKGDDAKRAKGAGEGKEDGKAPDTLEGTVLSDNKVVISKEKVKTLDYSVFFETPAFVFGDFSVKAGAMVGDVSDTDTKEYLNMAEIGFSLQGAYTTDLVKVAVAGDIVLGNVGGDKVKFNADTTLSASYSSLVGVDVYFAKEAIAMDVTTNKLAKNTKQTAAASKLLSASLKGDFSSLNIPVTVKVIGRDLINEKTRGIGVAVSGTYAGISADASFDYALSAKTYKIAGNIGYACDFVSAGVGFTYYSAKQLLLSASVESSAIIPGATVGIALSPIANSDGLLASDLLTKKWGRIDATCKISF